MMKHSTGLPSAFKITLALAFLILLAPALRAQVGNGQNVLQTVGVLDSLYSEILDESRKIYVQMPTDYNPEQDLEYPVAFILDGEVFLPTVYDVQKYYSGGFSPEMVLVGISNDENRMRDLTTSKVTSMYGMPFNEPNGEAERFFNFLEKELIPYIEENYPVTSYRSLIGHSYGGLFTLYALLNHPALFSNYLAIDPSLQWDDQKLLNEAQDLLGSNDFQNKALFMSLSGQLHMQNPEVTIDNVMEDSSDFTIFPRSNIAFSQMVEENNQNSLQYGWKFYPNDLHGTVPFPSIMDGLIAIFDWYQWENTDRINSFETSIEELSDIVKYREEKLKNHFGYALPPYPEDLLNMSGYMSMDMGQPEKAKMYFDFTIEYYPESANAYDSMADYYERQGDIANALKYVAIAYEKSGSEYHKTRMAELKEK